MTAAPPESPVTEAVRSLEVRWIFPGQLDAAVAGWFGRFPARMESREDIYLLDPQLPGLSVKVRGGGALEVSTRTGAGRRAGVRGGTHRGPHPWPGLVDAGIRGDGPRQPAPQRTRGHRRARVRPGPARRYGTRPR